MLRSRESVHAGALKHSKLRVLLSTALLVLLCAGLAGLHGVFTRERDEALRALDERDRAVVRAAQQTLRMRLSQRLHAARPSLERAVGDPLLDDAQLLLFRGGRQVLPRIPQAAAPSAPGAGRRVVVPLGDGATFATLRERPVLAYGYYVEAGEGPGDARGVKVDLPSELEAIREELRLIGLIEADDAIAVPVPDGMLTVDALPLQRLAPDGEAERVRLRARHAMKGGLLLGTALLGVGFVVFAGLAGARKRRLVAQRGELLATVSQELRTPLSAIRMLAETMQRATEGTPAASDYPARIVSETDGLSRRVENFLAFNRLAKGKVRLRLESVPLRELLEGVAGEMTSAGPARLQLDATAVGDARVKADGEMLRILISNLLHNACRHAGKEQVRVTAWAGLEGEYMTVRLADDGPGIPRERWEHVFGEYERLQGRAGAKGGGSGLGLTLCRRIMSLHGGVIRIVAPRGAVGASGSPGTTFELGFRP